MACEKREVLRVGGVSISQLPNDSTFFYEGGMAIDADGAPRAYHPPPDTRLGLDALRNAGRPGHWFGIVTDNGRPNGNPVIQGPNDPAPGFYVSSTSLQDARQDRISPSRYVDSSQIPYVVLPPEVSRQLGARLGDFAVVIRSRTRQLAEAIFADIGPRRKIGEGSIALADALGIPSSPRRGGVNRGVIYVIFPGAGNGEPRGIDEIIAAADILFETFGGMDQVDACFPR
jgi:hypothetical protein